MLVDVIPGISRRDGKVYDNVFRIKGHAILDVKDHGFRPGSKACMDSDELGECANPTVARSRTDGITDLELPDLGACLGDGSGNVVPQDEWRTIRKNGFELPIPYLGIQP